MSRRNGYVCAIEPIFKMSNLIDKLENHWLLYNSSQNEVFRVRRKLKTRKCRWRFSVVSSGRLKTGTMSRDRESGSATAQSETGRSKIWNTNVGGVRGSVIDIELRRGRILEYGSPRSPFMTWENIIFAVKVKDTLLNPAKDERGNGEKK